jgi:hypothetical protein
MVSVTPMSHPDYKNLQFAAISLSSLRVSIAGIWNGLLEKIPNCDTTATSPSSVSSPPSPCRDPSPSPSARPGPTPPSRPGTLSPPDQRLASAPPVNRVTFSPLGVPPPSPKTSNADIPTAGVTISEPPGIPGKLREKRKTGLSLSADTTPVAKPGRFKYLSTSITNFVVDNLDCDSEKEKERGERKTRMHNAKSEDGKSLKNEDRKLVSKSSSRDLLCFGFVHNEIRSIPSHLVQSIAPETPCVFAGILQENFRLVSFHLILYTILLAIP